MDAAARRKVLYLVGVLLMTFDLLTCVHSQGTGNVWFSLRNITNQNNSIVILEDIGEGENALLCMTNLTDCCRPPYTGVNGSIIGNWFFPNGTEVSSDIANATSGEERDFYRTRGQMVVRMNRKRGGVEGIYRCEIPDAINFTQTLYIGVYSLSTGAGDVWFSLGNVTYQNKSNVILENIGEGDDALLCKTNRTACCHHHIVGMRHSMGNWFFPNGTKVPRVNTTSGEMRDFYRDRGQMVVRMHRRGGGVEGIYRCEIPDTFGFIQTLYIGVYSLSTGAGDVWFSLNGITYQNNSVVILEDIGEGDDTLLCKTNQTACCRPPHSGNALGNWFFPNGTRVPSAGNQWDVHRTRGQMVVALHRRRGGVEGIYRCAIPDTFGFIQTIYIGVYSLSTGAGDIWFSLNGTTYWNNSIVVLEDIGEGDDALLCKTNRTACCRPPYTGERDALGNWFLPNGTKVPSAGSQWDLYRTRGQMVVRMNRRRGGEEGIYRCEIPDIFGFIQTICVGVYSASTGSPTVTGLTYDDQSRTLTCTSTGGPATTVTWRRDGVVITLNATYQQTKSLVDPVMSTYETVLTIDPTLHYSRVVGTYNCTVENDRGGSSETVVVPDDIWFSLNGTTYQNNSIVTLEDIGEDDDALLCITNHTACCRPPYTGETGPPVGNWFFPNGTRVPSASDQWDIHRDRGQMVVHLNRRRGGVEGIYRCEIPDAMNVNQTIYIGVYSASTGSPIITNLTYDDQSRTLTCTSTGGPATTVTWRRNGDVITLNATYQQTKSLVDPVMSTYETVLTIDPSLHYSHVVGTYNCTVENDRGGSSETVVVPGDVWFSLRNTTYQNNSIVTLEDIGEGDDALLCMTDLTDCCRPPGNGFGFANWFFPNETSVPSMVTSATSGDQSDFYSTRGQMVVRMHRRRGGVEGIYRCEIPISMNVNQTIYIGLYSASTSLPLPTATPPHPSIQPTPEATITPHEITQSTPGSVPVSSSTHQPTNVFPSDESTPSSTSPPSLLNGPIIIAIVTFVIIFLVILVGICIVVVLCRTKKKKQQLEINKLQNAMRETEETELKLKHEVNTQNGTFKKSREIEDEIQSDIEPFYEQLDVLHNGKPEDKKIKNKNQPREEPDAATQPYNAEMEAQYSQIPQKSFDPRNENEYSLSELYATVQKEAPPSVPRKSEELEEYLKSQNGNDSDIKLIPADSEYALPGNPSRIANISHAMFGEMESNPMYESMDHRHDPPSYTNVPEEATALDDIYSTPDTITPQPATTETVSETVYSEPIQPSHFTETARSRSSDSEDLQLYGPIYTAPSALPKREEMPLKVTGSNIREIRELGTGLFGKVILAETVGLSPKDLKMSESDDDKSKSTLVAVKTLKPRAPSTTKEAFEKEVNFMSRLNDRNVIRMIGVCREDTPFIMMEYMEKGDLNNYLRKFKELSTTDSEPQGQITTSTLVHMTTQIASAMKYLASHNYVHRDLATRNCLVGSNYLVKISDFGMSRSLYESHYYCIQGKAILPVRWMSVECFYGKFSQKSDVWAFGVTTWEIFTLAKEQPYNDMSDKQVVENALKGKSKERRLLAKPEMCPPEVYEIMLKCWAHNTKKRPTFEEIFQLLDSIHSV